MKRWTLRITICFILGVVTTVGVAWVFALLPIENGPFPDRESMTFNRDSDVERLMRRWYKPISIGSTYVALDARSRGFTEHYAWVRIPSTEFRGMPSGWKGEHHITATVIVAGWPMSALGGTTGEGQHVEIMPIRPMGSRTGIAPQPQPSMNRWTIGGRFPCFPILPGFLINTLFYAVIWFGLFFSMGRTRRFIRTQRGRCPRCGYDLRGVFSDGCPECGWERGISE